MPLKVKFKIQEPSSHTDRSFCDVKGFILVTKKSYREEFFLLLPYQAELISPYILKG